MKAPPADAQHWRKNGTPGKSAQWAYRQLPRTFESAIEQEKKMQ